MLQRCSALLHSRVVVFSESSTRFPASIVRRPEKTAASSSSIVLASRDEVSEPQKLTESSKFMMGYSSAPLIESGRQLWIRPTPELGLLSLLFALSMAVGAIVCLAIISIPTMTAIRRLIASMDLLSKVISKELPGTLSSLRLSGLEIKDLTQKLSNLSDGASSLFLEEERLVVVINNDIMKLPFIKPRACIYSCRLNLKIIRLNTGPRLNPLSKSTSQLDPHQGHLKASLAWFGTGMLDRRVTLDNDTKDLLSEFEGSVFQSLTSHTCSMMPGQDLVNDP